MFFPITGATGAFPADAAEDATALADAVAVSGSVVITPYKLLPFVLLSFKLATSSEAYTAWLLGCTARESETASTDLELLGMLLRLCLETSDETDCWLKCRPRFAVVSGACTCACK